MLAAALDLATRRMPPTEAPGTLQGILRLLPKPKKGEGAAVAEDVCEKLEAEQPLEEALDPDTGRPFLLTPYNREGESHRSPWSNKYHPPLPAEGDEEEGEPYVPAEALRGLEVEGNELWQVYGEMYYGGEAVGSVYLWEHEAGGGGGGAAGGGGVGGGAGGFAGCFAIKKRIKDGPGGLEQGRWDALHVVEALPALDGKSAAYKLTSSVLLSLAAAGEGVGQVDLSGSVTRQAEATHPLAGGAGALPAGQQHLANMGRMIEDMEIQIRSDVEALYLSRTREAVHAVRRAGGGSSCEEGGGAERRAAAAAAAAPRAGVRLPGMVGLPAGAELLAAVQRRRREEEEEVVEG